MPIKYYFFLQFSRLRRWFDEGGIHFALGLVGATFLFFLFSALFFNKLDSSSDWIYPMLSLSLLLKLGEVARNNQLKIIFNPVQFIQVRIIENVIAALPFILFLLYFEHYLYAGGLLLTAIAMCRFNSLRGWNKTIPTPFTKRPFENIQGFRKFGWFNLLFISFILLKSITVDNYNLGLVGMIYLQFSLLSYYLDPEEKFFVWIFKRNSSEFLKHKIYDSFICSSMITTPILISLLIFFPEKYMFSIIGYLLGFLFLILSILLKYSSFPKIISLPKILVGISCFLFPFMILFVLPTLYKHSKRALDPILS